MEESVNYINKLKQQLDFVDRSSQLYDAGHKDEAIRIATSIRVLLHGTPRSTSLLQHLNKTDIKLLTSAPGGGGFGSGDHTLVALGKARIYPDTEKIEYYPQLGNGYPGFYQQIDMEKWWNQVVMILDFQRMTRRDIVLAAANKDGGAHVDSQLTKEYETLSNYHSIED
jgi:hypothetical protein